MASETTNLQLKKPAATDFYSIDDFNTNWDKIDAALGTVQVKHLTDVDCHDLDTPGDYIITMSTPTGENSAAHHFPAEDGGWALTILASAPAESPQERIYIARAQQTGHIFEKHRHDGVWSEWARLATAEELAAHAGDKDNPHGVTAGQVQTTGGESVESALAGKIDKISYLLPTTDLNTVFASGNYRLDGDSSGFTNGPSGVNVGWSLLCVIGLGSDTVAQTLHILGGDIWTRMLQGGTYWSEWNRMATESALNAHTGNKNNPHGVTTEQIGAEKGWTLIGTKGLTATKSSNASSEHHLTFELPYDYEAGGFFSEIKATVGMGYSAQNSDSEANYSIRIDTAEEAGATLLNLYAKSSQPTYTWNANATLYSSSEKTKQRIDEDSTSVTKTYSCQVDEVNVDITVYDITSKKFITDLWVKYANDGNQTGTTTLTLYLYGRP